jgi:NADPH-dependent F420 reductase
MQIAVVGGTGREGRGLALRWARKGHRVTIGSRDAARAAERAAELSTPDVRIEGGDNAWAVARADVAVLAVPYAAHGETLRALKVALAGRVLVDLTVPLKPPQVTRVNLPPGGAAALEAQAILGEATPVVAALHHVSSVHLADPDHALEGDVLVCTDVEAARTTVTTLIADLGARALDAGPLVNAIALESLTPVLLHLNRRYKTNASLRILGV